MSIHTYNIHSYIFSYIFSYIKLYIVKYVYFFFDRGGNEPLS